MDRRAAAPFAHEARRLEGIRDDSRMRLAFTIGAAIGCAIILILLSGAFDSNQLRFTKDLYDILYAINNVAGLAYVPFNYSRVLNDTAMEVLLLDILPEAKGMNAVRHCVTADSPVAVPLTYARSMPSLTSSQYAEASDLD